VKSGGESRKTRRERWRKVPLPELPDYIEVSDLGRVKSLPYVDRRGWRRKLHYYSCGGAEVGIRGNDGVNRVYPVAALILRAFVGPPGEGQYLARHLDDNRGNNNLTNLAWGNDADNHADAVRNGRSFISYGHLGKPHSEETKQLLREQRLNKPTGHKMTEEHKTAMLVGYRQKFPEKEKEATPCGCGCGVLASPGKSFIRGHAGRVRFLQIAQERVGKPRAW
jgi:hypothetical protein